LGLTLGDFLWIGAELIQCGTDSVGGRPYGIWRAFLGKQLPPHLGGCQSGIQAMGAELWVGLALDDGLDSRQEVGEMRFRTLPPTQGKGIDTAHASGECTHACAHGHPAPPQFARGTLLPTRPQFFHRCVP
jgi:hypothetical protein